MTYKDLQENLSTISPKVKKTERIKQKKISNILKKADLKTEPQ